MNSNLGFLPPVVALVSFFLFGIIGIFLTYRYRDNGVITGKGILLSAASFMMSGLSLVLIIVLTDNDLFSSAFFLFCLLFFSVGCYTLYHLSFLYIYNRRQQRGKNREINGYLNDMFKKQ